MFAFGFALLAPAGVAAAIDASPVYRVFKRTFIGSGNAIRPNLGRFATADLGFLG